MRMTSAEYGISGTTILDLGEPLRSNALAELGMTADEFADHILGWQAQELEGSEMAATGETPAYSLHYDDAPLANVVKR